jgi:hypothetical protein
VLLEFGTEFPPQAPDDCLVSVILESNVELFEERCDHIDVHHLRKPDRFPFHRIDTTDPSRDVPARRERQKKKELRMPDVINRPTHNASPLSAGLQMQLVPTVYQPLD